MALDGTMDHRPRRTTRSAEARTYRLVYAVTFAICLLVAVVARLMPWTWLSASRHENQRRSVLAEARSAASIAIGYAFMT